MSDLDSAMVWIVMRVRALWFFTASGSEPVQLRSVFSGVTEQPNIAHQVTASLWFGLVAWDLNPWFLWRVNGTPFLNH